jgi:hypothetical protein
MKQIELLIYILFFVFMLLLVLKYWKTGRKD